MNDAKIVGTSALVLDTAKPPEEAKLDSEVSLIEKEAASVVVASDDGFALAGELTKQVKQMQKQVTDYWEPMRKSTYDAYAAVNQHKKQMLDPLMSAEKILKEKMGAYSKERERILREQEEDRRKAAEVEMNRKLAEAVEAEASGDAIGAEMAMAEAEVMEGVSISSAPSQAPKAKGVTQTKTWKIKRIDSEKVPISFAGIELRPVDEKLVLQLIKASKGNIVIPGVEYEEDVIIGIRA
jgi:predicted ribosome quality control (RQC) complex YloA/Tae2 family protein